MSMSVFVFGKRVKVFMRDLMCCTRLGGIHVDKKDRWRPRSAEHRIDLHILIINAHSQGTWVPVPFDLVQLKKAS